MSIIDSILYFLLVDQPHTISSYFTNIRLRSSKTVIILAVTEKTHVWR